MSEKIDYSKGIYDARQLGTGRMLILGLQHMFAMFGATVLVPLLTGLSVSTTLLCAGLGTLLFHLVTKGKVPAFLGSSFAFLGSMAAAFVPSVDPVSVTRISSGNPATLSRHRPSTSSSFFTIMQRLTETTATPRFHTVLLPVYVPCENS